MANTPDQNQDPISLAWNKSRQLRDELAANAGTPDELRDKNLEINPLTDVPLTAAGSLATSTGKGIKEISLGDVVRAVRSVPDMVSDAATESENNIGSNPFVSMQLGMKPSDVEKATPKDNAIAEAGRDVANSDTAKATVNAAIKGADLVEKGADYVDSNVVKPVVKPIGNAIEGAGETVKSWRSEDAKAADNSTLIDHDANGNMKLGNTFTDPARLAIQFANLFGTTGGVVLSSYAGGVAGKTNLIKGMVTKSMLKRGASEEFAAQVANDTAKRWAEKSGIAAGINMSTGDTADQARQSYDQVSDQDKLNSPIFRDTVTAVQGEFPDLTSTERMKIVDERMRDKLASASLSNPTTYAAAATGTILGDAVLAKMVLGNGAPMSGNVLTRAAKGFAKGSLNEGLSEGAEGGMQQYVSNVSSNDVAGTAVDPMQGVGTAVAENALGGALMGGPVGSFGGAIHKAKPQPASNSSQDETASPIQPENVHDISAARQEIETAQKTPGSFSIGKSGDGYQAVFVDGAGQVNETPVFATAEEAQQAVTGNANAVRQDVSPQPQNDAQASQQPDDLANIPAFMRNGQELSPELEQARNQAMNNAWQDAQAQQAKTEPGVMQPREKTVTGNPDEPAFLRTQQNNPTGRDTSTLQDADPYTQAQAALAKGGAPTADDLIQQSIQNGNQGKTPQEAGLTGDLLLAKQQPGVPATTEQSSGATVDGQANEVIPESRGLGYSGTINMPGSPGNGINNSYVPPVTQSRQTADKSLGAESTRDPRSPVAQSIAQAGTESDSIFGQLKSLRVTKRGKPFGSIKEAQLASRPTETPIALPAGGFGVVDKAELEQAQAIQAPAATITNDGAKSKNIPDSILSAFPDMQVSNEGYLGLNPFTLSEREALKNAGLVQEVKSADGSSYLAVDPEKLWDLRKTRSEELKNTKSEVSIEERNRGIENRARNYDRVASEQESLGDLGDQELAKQYRKKAQEIRSLKTDAATQATINQPELKRDGNGDSVITQNQPDINVNESSNGQANANQPIADQAVGTPSPDTVTPPVVAMEGQPTPAPATNNLKPTTTTVAETVTPSPAVNTEGVISKTAKTETTGKSVTLHTPSGKQVKTEYRLVEADNLIASHDFDGNTNSQFPQNLQPRDRSRVASRQQLFNIAQNPAPERLTESAETDRGAPIVKNGIVESGNGRVIGLTEAYRRGNAEEYKRYLAEHAAEYGLTAEQVNSMEQPVLVRERITEMSPEEVREFTVDSNRGAGLSLGATEQANADAASLNKDLLSLLSIPESGDVLSRENDTFLNAFGATLGNNELAQYKTADGAWNQAFKRRIENAIFAKGYGNPDLVAEMSEATKPEVKNLLTALMNTASKLAELRAFDEEAGGTLATVYAEAAGIVARSRRDNQSVSEMASQSDLFGGGVSEDAKLIAEWIDNNARSAKKISELLSRLTSRLLDNAKNNSQADIFTGKPEEKITVTDAINEEQARRTKQTANTQRPGADLLGANTERANTGTDNSAETATGRDRSRGESEASGVDDNNVQFSKFTPNEAEKSGKGMTKPEATLAAKEWLKQFKTDINVEVVKDQAEFESALADRGFANSIQSGEMDNAAYLPDSKTILINASAIQNPKRLKQIMRHEILVHHGLRYVVGEEAYAKIMNAIARGYETSPAIRDAVDTVTKNYADKDMFTQMEEAFAHYAENRPADSGPIGRLWQRIVGMVKSALQKVNFISVNEAEQQLDSVLHAIARNMRKGIEDGVMAERSSDAMFSRSSTADDELMTKLGLGPKPNLAEKTKSQIDALKQTDRNTVKAWIKKVGRQANTQILDALAPIKYAEESAGSFDATNSAYVAARLSSGSASVMQATMLYGLPEWKDGVVQRKNGTTDKDALLGIFSDLGTDLHNWLAWMAGHRAEILMQEGRENLLSAADIAKLKLKGAGKEAKFNEAKKKWNKLNGAVLDMAQESGLIKAEERANWESEWYIPFFRETDDGDVTAPFKKNGIANQSSGIKKLKGGTANVNDLLENIFTTTGKLIDASMKNMAAQKLVHNLADTDLISIIDKPNLMDLKAAFKNQGNKMTVRVDGEDHVIHVSDPDLFKAMTMIDMKVDRDPFRKLAMKAKHLITAGVTASPDFMLRNFLRDAASTWAINEDGFKPMIDSIRGVKKAWKMDDSSINMMFSGASFMGGNVRGNDPTAMATTVRKVLKRKGMSPEQINEYESSLITTGIKAKEVIGHYWEKYEQAGEAVENGSREAVYEAAIKAGKSHAQAAFEAKDLMDFSMLGSSKIMRYMVDVLPFFNARMQGLGKLGRAMAANPKQIAKRGGMIAAASLALLAMNWDDDRYNDLPDWDKDLNWHFWLGDQHFRIPKPFEIGLMFGTLPERMARTMGGKDTAGKFGKVVARNMLETFAINPIPQVVKPLTEAYFNYDPFRGGPIESMSDMNVNPEARYDERTSLMMRELGELTGMSPKRLEHVVLGYTGTMGGYVMAMGDGLVRMMGDYGDAPAIRADQIPVLKSIYQGSAPAKSSQAITDFYQLLDESNQIYATIRQYNKEGRTDDARELLEENRTKLYGRKAMSQAQKQFTSLRNEITLIQRDRILNSDEKRQRIDKLLAQRNNMAAKLMQRFGTEL